jgi:hypothetical protein
MRTLESELKGLLSESCDKCHTQIRRPYESTRKHAHVRQYYETPWNNKANNLNSLVKISEGLQVQGIWEILISLNS